MAIFNSYVSLLEGMDIYRLYRSYGWIYIYELYIYGLINYDGYYYEQTIDIVLTMGNVMLGNVMLYG